MLTPLIRFLCLCQLVLLLQGCFGSGASTSTPLIRKASSVPVNVSPEARADYQEALDAMKNGDTGKAKTLLQTLVKNYPDLSGPHTNLGLLYYREQKMDDAETAFLKAIEINPGSSVSYNHLGIINRGRGKFKEAEDFYLKALEADGEYALAHLNIGILYDLYLGRLKKAKNHYERFQELSKEQDKEVEKWLIDLDRRIKSR